MQSISKWLQSLGLDQYAQVFTDNDIDLDLIPSLSDQGLKELGVSSMGHRKKLLKAIAEFDNPTTRSPAASATAKAFGKINVTSEPWHELTSGAVHCLVPACSCFSLE
jgi:hypothetical protein